MITMLSRWQSGLISFFLFGVIIYQWIFQWTHYLASVIARIKITKYYALARDMPVIHTNH